MGHGIGGFLPMDPGSCGVPELDLKIGLCTPQLMCKMNGRDMVFGWHGDSGHLIDLKRVHQTEKAASHLKSCVQPESGELGSIIMV